MKELLKISPKIQGFFNFLGALLRLEGVNLDKKSKVGCSNVSGTNWENSLLKPWENGHFSTFSPIFPLVPLKNLALTPINKLRF